MTRFLKLKRMIVRTPLEGLGLKFQDLLGLWSRFRNPELAQIYGEDAAMAACMKRLLDENDCCVDVGCHIGSVLSRMLRLCGKGKHVAFEPVTDKALWLRKKFPEVQVFEIALGESDGTVPFFENISQPGYSGFSSTRADTSSDTLVRRDVRMRRLDDVLGADASVDFVKIDVEGAELGVLRGARATIKKCQPVIVFESGPGGAEACGYSRKELFDYLVGSLGYGIYVFSDFLADLGPLEYSEFDKCHEFPFRAFNYLAIPTPNSESGKSH